MKFKSPTVERIMTRLSQSIAGGIFIPILLLLVISLTGREDAENPFLDTRPLIYILIWPHLLWKYILDSEAAYAATAASIFVIYSLLTYWFIRQRADRSRLP